MIINKIKTAITAGESITREFKESRTTLNKDVYETVCSFLNRNGGELLLGVKDNGTITGIDPGCIEQIKKDFTTAVNNPAKISPSVYLSMEQVEIDGKLLLYIYIPESSQVHKCGQKIFDRNEDGDFDITRNNTLVTALYIKKQTFYTENRIFPYCEISDLDLTLIQKVQKSVIIQRPDHPWKNLSPLELLKSSRLYNRDFNSGEEGITLAGILLFGKDETILSALPHHKTDLILRIKNLDRYDDRDDVRTNLLDSYDRIIQFGQKHLPDPFYLEGSQRISVRDVILREVAVNLLIHREYINAYPAKMIIEKDRLLTENGNKPHGHGLIDPENFSPFPKNPSIARVFKEIGLAEELGSGVRNIVKYGKFYSSTPPRLVEEDIFKSEICFKPSEVSGIKEPKKTTQKDTTQKDTTQKDTTQKDTTQKDTTQKDTTQKDTTQKDTTQKILDILKEKPTVSRKEIAVLLGSITEDGVKYHLNNLKKKGLIKRVGPDRGGHWVVL